MKITEKVLEKDFKDENSKNAYLKACKWLAKYVLSKDLVPLVETDNSYISLRYDDSGKGYYLTREYDKYFNPYIYVPKYCKKQFKYCQSYFRQQNTNHYRCY